MKNTVFYFIFLSLFVTARAQKTVQKTIDARGIKTLVITGDQCFKISVESTTGSAILMTANIEGEHSEHVVLVSEIENENLFVSTDFQPLFKEDNDKLSAHKVMSIELSVQVPDYLNVHVISKIASTTVTGNLKSLRVELNNGNCSLKNFDGSTFVNTFRGDIAVETNYTSSIDAKTKYGKVTKAVLDFGENTLKLNSIYGDISITKSKK